MLRVRRAVSQLLDLFEHILHLRNHAAHLPCDAFVAPALLGDKVFQLLHGSDEVGLVGLVLKPSSGISGIPRFLGELKLLADTGHMPVRLLKFPLRSFPSVSPPNPCPSSRARG